MKTMRLIVCILVAALLAGNFTYGAESKKKNKAAASKKKAEAVETKTDPDVSASETAGEGPDAPDGKTDEKEQKPKSGNKVSPDLTKDLSAVKEPDVQEWKSWMMGPTGARIWVWADHKTIWSDGAVQIYVVKVDSKTPASGKLEAGDVILGAAGGEKVTPFVKNARSEVAQAITDAEKAENKGLLSLLVWRPSTKLGAGNGTTSTVTLTLPVMGTFSATSPVNCEKTKLIVDQIAARIVEKGDVKGPGIPEYINALGLLATGDEKYLPAVKALAHKVGPPDTKLGPEHNAWISAYTLIFLAEYYAATKDDYVKPALTEYATKLARARSGASSSTTRTVSLPPPAVGLANGISFAGTAAWATGR